MMHKKHSNSSQGRKRPGHFKLLTSCPLCKALYKPAQALILDERAGRHLVHIQCGRCGNAVLALVAGSAEGQAAVGMVTDLTSEDALRFKDLFGISADDVIGMHEALKEDKSFIEKLKSNY